MDDHKGHLLAKGVYLPLQLSRSAQTEGGVARGLNQAGCPPLLSLPAALPRLGRHSQQGHVALPSHLEQISSSLSPFSHLIRIAAHLKGCYEDQTSTTKREHEL